MTFAVVVISNVVFTVSLTWFIGVKTVMLFTYLLSIIKTLFQYATKVARVSGATVLTQ